MKFFLLCLMLRIGSWFSNQIHATKAHKIKMDSAKDLPSPILDLGGGGAGVIGQRYGNRVTAIDLHQEELDETPEGPIKVVGDARNLPFAADSFAAVTAFYFFMYTKAEDHLQMFKEAYRVLKPEGTFTIWDTAIKPQGDRKKQLFVVPVRVQWTKKTVPTAYGTPWKGKIQTEEMLKTAGLAAGFETMEEHQEGEAFRLVLLKK